MAERRASWYDCEQDSDETLADEEQAWVEKKESVSSLEYEVKHLIKGFNGSADKLHTIYPDTIYYLGKHGNQIHNGQKGYSHAIKCIDNLTLLKKKLIIISNSSKRSITTISRLPKLGFNKDDFQVVLTSGEIVWQNLFSKLFIISIVFLGFRKILISNKPDGKL